MNTANLKNALRDTDWTPVYVNADTDTSFDTFWNIFKALYDEHFPEIRVKFNINKHKLNGFMTDELLEARKNKITSHKVALLSKSLEDREIYTNYIETNTTPCLGKVNKNTMSKTSIEILIMQNVRGNS
jgi:hypothetical protein